MVRKYLFLTRAADRTRAGDRRRCSPGLSPGVLILPCISLVDLRVPLFQWDASTEGAWSYQPRPSAWVSGNDTISQGCRPDLCSSREELEELGKAWSTQFPINHAGQAVPHSLIPPTVIHVASSEGSSFALGLASPTPDSNVATAYLSPENEHP